MTSHANLAKRIVSILFMLSLLSSVSAAYFVNVDINLTSAKKSSHSNGGGGGSNHKENGDSVGSNGNTGGNTTTPSIAQGTTTTTPSIAQGTTTTTPSIAQGTTNSPTSINGAPLTPQQQYEQCLGGIGGGIPGNCKPPSSTNTEQNASPQTLTPQQTCQDGSTPSANGICQGDSTPQQACPGNVARNSNGICFSPTPISTCPLNTVRVHIIFCVPPFPGVLYNGSLILKGGKLGMPTVPPIPNTNTIAPICPSYSYLAGSKCVGKNYYCPSGYTQDEDICTPTNTIIAKVFTPPCASGYSRDPNGGLYAQCLPIPPATPPSNTPPGQP